MTKPPNEPEACKVHELAVGELETVSGGVFAEIRDAILKATGVHTSSPVVSGAPKPIAMPYPNLGTSKDA